MKVKYVGTKQSKRVQLPVPFLSLSEAAGDVTFAGPGDVQEMDEANARALVAIEGSPFELVEEKKAKEPKESKSGS